jgi:hypothetical protein
VPLPPGHVRIASCEDALKASEDFQSFPVKGCPLPRRSAGILAYSSRNVLFSSYTLLRLELGLFVGPLVLVWLYERGGGAPGCGFMSTV